MAFEFAGATDVGRKRDHNEDALLVLPEHNVAVVCDGMGGHEAGEVASGIGIETVKRFFEIAFDLEATWPFRYDRSKDEGTNLLSVRHDRTAKFPETNGINPLYNPKSKGNVNFCDGHAEFIPRSQLNDPTQANMAIFPFY